jgi:hypothetical protein
VFEGFTLANPDDFIKIITPGRRLKQLMAPRGRAVEQINLVRDEACIVEGSTHRKAGFTLTCASINHRSRAREY